MRHCEAREALGAARGQPVGLGYSLPCAAAVCTSSCNRGACSCMGAWHSPAVVATAALTSMSSENARANACRARQQKHKHGCTAALDCLAAGERLSCADSPCVRL